MKTINIRDLDVSALCGAEFHEVTNGNPGHANHVDFRLEQGGQLQVQEWVWWGPNNGWLRSASGGRLIEPRDVTLAQARRLVCGRIARGGGKLWEEYPPDRLVIDESARMKAVVDCIEGGMTLLDAFEAASSVFTELARPVGLL